MTENYFLYVGTEGGNLLTTNQDSNLKAKKRFYFPFSHEVLNHNNFGLQQEWTTFIVGGPY